MINVRKTAIGTCIVNLTPVSSPFEASLIVPTHVGGYTNLLLTSKDFLKNFLNSPANGRVSLQSRSCQCFQKANSKLLFPKNIYSQFGVIFIACGQ